MVLILGLVASLALLCVALALLCVALAAVRNLRPKKRARELTLRHSGGAGFSGTRRAVCLEQGYSRLFLTPLEATLGSIMRWGVCFVQGGRN